MDIQIRERMGIGGGEGHVPPVPLDPPLLSMQSSLVPRPRFLTAAGALHHRYVESGDVIHPQLLGIWVWGRDYMQSVIEVREPLRKTINERDWVMSHRASMLKTIQKSARTGALGGVSKLLFPRSGDVIHPQLWD